MDVCRNNACLVFPVAYLPFGNGIFVCLFVCLFLSFFSLYLFSLALLLVAFLRNERTSECARTDLAYLVIFSFSSSSEFIYPCMHACVGVGEIGVIGVVGWF